MRRYIGRVAGVPAVLIMSLTWGLFASAGLVLATERAGAATRAVVVDIDGPIGPAMADYVEEALDEATDREAALVVLRMDTPGGLDRSMRRIIRAVLDSSMPVIGFVAPSGARAASAGTYILYATHVAAMAPGTNLGAATPVEIGGGLLPRPDSDGGDDAPVTGEPGAESVPGDARTRKMVNDAAAYLRSLADLRGRNADWAEKAVREGVSLTAQEALEAGVVDVIADDVEDLLVKVDGRSVNIGGTVRTLETRDAVVEQMAPGWQTRLLAVLTNPNVAFILMLVGIYGLIFEMANPGAVVPGVIGAISLVLGLYALNILPVNHAGLGLLLLGIAFMVAEAFVPSFGILGFGGIVAFVVGATMLFDTDTPAFTLSIWVIGSATAVTAVLLLIVVAYIVKTARRPVVTGLDQMIGSTGEVDDWSGHEGHVLVGGERWRATAERSFSPGAKVKVVQVDGLVVKVEADPAPGRDDINRTPWLDVETDMILNGILVVALAALIIAFFATAIHILREYERGVVFTLGRFTRVAGPGFVILIPVIQKMVRVDLRIRVEDVPTQDVISHDNVSVQVNAVIYFRVVDAARAILQVEDFLQATSQLAQTTLRSVLGKHELDEMLAERDRLNNDIQEILDRQTDAWGVKVNNVEIKHVDLDTSMIRAIAKQAEAERVRRARIINAEGEQQAAEKLVEAAQMLGTAPQALQLRYLTALQDIAGDKSSTIVFPLPIDMLAAITASHGNKDKTADTDKDKN